MNLAKWPKAYDGKWPYIFRAGRSMLRAVRTEMSQNVRLIVVPKGCDEATAQALTLLSQAGLSVVRSFDLRSARSAHTVCTCPHHGTAECTCQYIVLLVYAREGAPITLVVHGQNGRTEFSFVDNPQQHADPWLLAQIAATVTADRFR